MCIAIFAKVLKDPSNICPLLKKKKKNQDILTTCMKMIKMKKERIGIPFFKKSLGETSGLKWTVDSFGEARLLSTHTHTLIQIPKFNK
jgi:hypothetical protein